MLSPPLARLHVLAAKAILPAVAPRAVPRLGSHFHSSVADGRDRRQRSREERLAQTLRDRRAR